MIPLILMVVLITSLWWMNNTLVARKNDVAKAFSSIDVMLKKRYDLIPNLVETLKVYIGYERGLLADLTELRSRAMNTGTGVEDRLKTETLLTQKLGNIMVVAENYPDLKANRNFLQLQAAWNETEEQIAASRRAYNASVTEYNNSVEMFPTNMLATMMKYKPKTWFESGPEEKTNIKAENLFNS